MSLHALYCLKMTKTTPYWLRADIKYIFWVNHHSMAWHSLVGHNRLDRNLCLNHGSDVSSSLSCLCFTASAPGNQGFLQPNMVEIVHDPGRVAPKRLPVTNCSRRTSAKLSWPAQGAALGYYPTMDGLMKYFNRSKAANELQTTHTKASGLSVSTS